MLGSQSFTVTTKQIQALLTAARVSGGKDECQVRLTGIEREYWMGIEIGRLGGYSFQGTVPAGDRSNQKSGKMEAGYVNLRKKRTGQHRTVGRGEEGSSSNRPELVDFVLALHSTPVTNPMLLLCDNQALLKSVKRWVGEGGKVTLVGAPDAVILLEAIEELRKTTAAGAAMVLVKVKAHRGEPADEEADIQADKAISGKDVPTEWHNRTNRAVFTWQEPRRRGGMVSYEDPKSTWRRVDVSYDPSMVTALQLLHGWMRKVSKRLVSTRRKKGEASTSLSTVHGQLRQDARRFMLGKYLSDKKIPWN